MHYIQINKVKFATMTTQMLRKITELEENVIISLWSTKNFEKINNVVTIEKKSRYYRKKILNYVQHSRRNMKTEWFLIKCWSDETKINKNSNKGLLGVGFGQENCCKYIKQTLKMRTRFCYVLGVYSALVHYRGIENIMNQWKNILEKIY